MLFVELHQLFQVGYIAEFITHTGKISIAFQNLRLR